MAIDLSTISRNRSTAPPRVVVYGPHGIGKTTFGAHAPAPVVLPYEDGLGGLDVDAFPLIASWDDTLGALGALYTEAHDFGTVVIDSLDWLEPIVWAETCKRHGQQDIEAFGYGKGFLFALDVWREFFAGLVALRQDKGMAIILLAHAEIKRFDDPTNEPYDRYQLKLQPRAAALVEEWADCVLFANYKTFTAKTDAGFNKKVTRGVGTGERVMYTEERPGWKAKNRYSLAPELPFSWQAFAAGLESTPTPAASDAA